MTPDLSDPGSELRVVTRDRRRLAKLINGMSKKNNNKNMTLLPGILQSLSNTHPEESEPQMSECGVVAVD